MIRLVSFSDYGFSVSALWCPLATPTVLLRCLLPWTWSISSRPSSKAQPLLLTLEEGYLLTAAPPDLECGVAPLGPPAPVQPPLLGRKVAPSGHCPWPWMWPSLKSILCLRETRTGQSSSKVLTCSHFNVCVCTHLCPTHDPMDQSLPGFSVEFSRQEHWKKLLFPIPVNLPDSGLKSCPCHLLH